ncbi:MAG: GNAT family N-acetyltransferase [Bacteroidales bacterium]|nr:GNAT family N-acetyltransferase [Bacteroidales bacterium]
MKIIRGNYKHLNEAKSYFALLKELYGSSNGYDYYSGDLRNALQHCLTHPEQEHQYIAIQEEQTLMAHAILIRDDRLPEGEIFFGFFECRSEGTFFESLWSEMMAVAASMGARLMRGPVNGSIWHAYRVVSYSDPGFPVFNSEPVTQQWYYRALKEKSPVEESTYYSGSRKNYGFIILHTAASYQMALAEGLEIVIPEKINTGIMGQIYSLSRATFLSSWAYTELSLEEFIRLYSDDKIDKHIGKVCLLMKGDRLVGFCTTVKDHGRMIIKTIAVHSEYREKGYGNALVHKVHADAEKEGVSEIIYALIRSGNKVSNFPQDQATIFREYAGFSFRI